MGEARIKKRIKELLQPQPAEEGAPSKPQPAASIKDVMEIAQDLPWSGPEVNGADEEDIAFTRTCERIDYTENEIGRTQDVEEIETMRYEERKEEHRRVKEQEEEANE